MATKPREMRVAACKWCGGTLYRSRPWQEFCNDRHRYHWHNAHRQKTKGSQAISVGAAGEQNKKQEKPETNTIRRGTRLHSIAAALYRGERLDCFSDVRLHDDYVLPSTISELANRYGVQIERRHRTCPGCGVALVGCVEYQVSEEGLRQLAALLDAAPCPSRT